MNRKIGVILSYVLMIFEVLSTLLLTPFIIRTLGQAEYGVYKLAAAVNSYLLLLDLGVGNAITRFVSKYRVENDLQQSRKFMGVAVIYYSVIAIISIVVGIILIVVFPSAFAKGLSYKQVALGQRLLAITMINSAVTLGTAPFNNVLIAYEKFGISKGSSIIQILFRMVLTYFTLKWGMGSIGIVSVNLFMTILCRGFFVYYLFFRVKLLPMFSGIKFAFVKEIVLYSSLILLQMIATHLNATVDQVLLGALVPAAAAIIAVYGVGTQIAGYFQSIGSSFNGILMPGVVKLVEKGATPKELTEEMIRIGRLVFMVGVLIWGGFLVCGIEFVNLWAGKDNIEAYKVAMILITAYLFITTESIGSQILWAKNQHKEQAYLKILIVLLNLVLTIVLIKWKPLIGATIGTFISLMLGDVGVMNLIFVKKLKIDMIHYYKSLFKGILPCLIISVVVGLVLKQLFFTGWSGLIIKIAAMVVVYSISMLSFGMNRYEKNLLLSLARRRR